MTRGLVLLLLLPGCTVVLQQVADYEDRRAASELEPFTQVDDPRVRARALLGLGRIQDPRFAGAIAARLTDPVPEVRDEAAFAAGLLGMSWQPLPEDTRQLLADALLEAEARAKGNARLIEALGRIATPLCLGRLVERAEGGDDRAALALALAVKRGAKAEPSFPKLKPGYGRAYLAVVTKTREPLLDALADPNPEVRALGAKGLASAGRPDDAEALKRCLADPDVRVAVEAVRALAKLKLDPGPLDGRVPVLLAAAQAGLDLPVPGKEPKLECRMAMARDAKSGVLEASAKCGALALHALAEAPPKDVAGLERFLKEGTPAEQLGALDAIGAAKATALAPQLRPLLESSDAILAAAAAGALAKLQDKASIPALRRLAASVPGAHDDVAPAVADAIAELDAKEAAPELTAWLIADNATVRHTAAAALTKLTGAHVEAVEQSRLKAASMPDTGSGLLLTTERGEIEIELWNDETPRTAGNLWSLARRGYFDGLTFHRIVPDFVAQGGDPRGDGEGGPGYMIRCEIGHRPYVRGTVGMALSGKDTGGSQFFITHTATPHLDGKYTAFGQVKRGLDVVDALLEGDRIIKVIALP